MSRLIHTAVLLLFAILHPGCQSTEVLHGQIEKIMRHDTDVSLDQVPGFIVGIIDGDSTYVLPYGAREAGSNQMLTVNDVFELGSVTKVMTADIILQLNEERTLDVFAPLNHYLPVAYQNPLVQATLMDVLTHRSGLPKIPETLGNTQTDMNSPYSGFTNEDLLSWYHNLRSVSMGEFRYSHAGYALLELVIEQATNDSYEHVFDQYISKVYKISNTRVDNLLRICPGYDLAGREARNWEFNAFRGSEGARSNLRDMMSYVRTLIDQEETKLTWTTSHPTSDKKLFIAPGWYRFLPKKEFPVYVHTGRTSGHSVMIAFSRKTQTGVIVLANSSTGTDDLGLLILRMINRQWRRKI